MTTIRVPAGQDITPAWNVQAFVDAVSKATGADSFGTYIGHEPTAELAVDCFVQVWTTELGNKICDFALPHIDTYGIDYVIFRQKIYNPEIATYWRQMDDRGSPTANHYDHVHLSFVEMARKPIPAPPDNLPKGDIMALSVRYVWGPDALNQTDWVFDGPSQVFATGMTAEVLAACDKNKIVEMGHVEDQTHEWFRNVASNWR